MKKLPKKTNTLIVGGGLSGLTAASLLEQKGESYVLVEKEREFSGLIRPQKTEFGILDYGLKSIPVTGSVASHPLVILKNRLGLEIGIQSDATLPITTSKAGFVEFTGFGETKQAKTISEMEYYTSSPRLWVAGGWHHLCEKLLGLIPEQKHFTQTQITRFEIQDGRAVRATINGTNTIEFDRLILAISPFGIQNLIPDFSPKTLSKIAKNPPLSSISLDLITDLPFPTDHKGHVVLRDTGDEEFTVVGQFQNLADPEKLNSQRVLSTWLTLMDQESLDDEGEFGSKIIKNIKRLVKKSFPTLFEGKYWERILVVPHSHGQFETLPLKDDQKLSDYRNVSLIGSQLPGPHRNLAQALATAQNAVATETHSSPEIEPVLDTSP